MTTRRAVLAGALAAPLATPSRAQGLVAQRTFVLIHGTFHGGWVWKWVREYLQDRGHRVFTPTLTGCGERVHLATPETGLRTHITDILNVVEYEDLTDIVFSAHSFSGVAMTGVADALRAAGEGGRIRHLNYFDALVPRPGRMSGVERNADGEIVETFRKREPHFIDDYKMDFFEDYPLKMLMPENHPRADWVAERLTPHPARAWTDELVLKAGGWDGLSRSYVHCTGQAFAKTSEKMIGPARGPGWDFRELDVARNGMVTDPQAVAEMLLEVSA